MADFNYTMDGKLCYVPAASIYMVKPCPDNTEHSLLVTIEDKTINFHMDSKSLVRKLSSYKVGSLGFVVEDGFMAYGLENIVSIFKPNLAKVNGDTKPETYEVLCRKTVGFKAHSHVLKCDLDLSGADTLVDLGSLCSWDGKYYAEFAVGRSHVGHHGAIDDDRSFFEIGLTRYEVDLPLRIFKAALNKGGLQLPSWQKPLRVLKHD